MVRYVLVPNILHIQNDFLAYVYVVLLLDILWLGGFFFYHEAFM
uniref:Uncharacterized protein n=1 Tax=Arundo donax TaxID=35708 RepID=A0A0A9BAQ7_ARUDO